MGSRFSRFWRDHPYYLLVLCSLSLYLGWSWLAGHVGFALDDAWIHQTYARNLIETGQWAFVPGQPSSGSTAPLWTLLLAVGYALGQPYRLWTWALGALCLAATATAAASLTRRLGPFGGPGEPGRSWPRIGSIEASLVVGLACAVEWHLVWSAVSGMEILLFALLALLFWCRLVVDPTRRPFLTGLVGGALILTRPEGILAVGLGGVGVVLAEGVERRWRRGLAAGGLLALGTGLIVAPYVAWNVSLSGTAWPNTMYAKQTEYAIQLAQPLLVRLWEVGRQPLVGGQVLLLPGLVWGMWGAMRRKGGRGVLWWLPLAWVAAAVGAYAVRLPVTYQHGRYLMPVIPVLLVYGVGGTLAIRVPSAARRRWSSGWLLGLGARAWAWAAVVLFATFGLWGAQVYATDVAIIEEEMVAVARWLNDQTEVDTLVAVHDIGAVGYFSERPLLDLAGLVTPEVIPYMRDEARLLDWLEARGAEYLVTFPSWYPVLAADPRLEQVYQTDAAVTVRAGGENMAVYRIHWSGDE